jgi:hypothetical protein
VQNFEVFRDFFIAKPSKCLQNTAKFGFGFCKATIIGTKTFYTEVPHGKEKSSKETSSQEKR